MKIFFTAFCISLFIQSIIIPQRKIEIRVISTLPQNQKVFITGNTPELGNWNPNKISLYRVNDSTWSKVFEFLEGETIKYKLTLGSWEKEALNEKGQKSGNNILKISDDTVLVFNITNWGYSQTNISGQITGNVRYHKKFKGRSVLPRDIIVWLPPGYDSLSDKYYPVLYMHDGQNVFDPLTSSFGVDWQIDEVADSLIRARSIQEIIIVGIYNTEDRGSEYNDTELGQTYINFMIEELKPFIDMTYRTLPDSKNTAVCGSSSGGLISFIMGWEYPDVFSKSACFSPAFKISNINYVAPVENYMGAKKNLKVFIYNGGIGLEERLQPGIDEMMLILKEKGYVENQDLLFIKDSSAEHNEYVWAKNVYRFLEYFFPLE
jgi:predicted alpha/beta superfamily hydrolase